MKSLFLIIILGLVTAFSFSQEGINSLLVARSYMERGEYSSTLSTIESSSEAQSDYRYKNLEGEMFLRSSDFSSAITAFNGANQIKESSGDLGLAMVYAGLGDSKTSMFYLENHLKSEFKEPLKSLSLNTYLQKIESSAEWKQLWKKSWYNELEVGVAEVEYILKSGGTAEEASSAASTFTGLYSERAEVDYVNGLILMARNDFSGAIGKLRSSIEKDNSNYGAWIATIEAIGSSGDNAGAAKQADLALAIFPDQLPLYLTKIGWLRRAGDRELAFTEIEKLLPYYPDNEKVLYFAGLLSYETRRYGTAIQYVSKNIEINPGNPQYFSSRGDIYFATKTWEFAANDFSMALDLDPRDGTVYYRKALSLIELGQIDNACHDLRQARKLGDKRASALISKLCIR
jgi:tetratricopeptide (TPR) repeat protein